MLRVTRRKRLLHEDEDCLMASQTARDRNTTAGAGKTSRPRTGPLGRPAGRSWLPAAGGQFGLASSLFLVSPAESQLKRTFQRRAGFVAVGRAAPPRATHPLLGGPAAAYYQRSASLPPACRHDFLSNYLDFASTCKKMFSEK